MVSYADEFSLADVVSLSDLIVFHMRSFIQSVRLKQPYRCVSQSDAVVI